MSFLTIEEKLIFEDQKELITTHFYLLLKKKGLDVSPKDLDLLVELYRTGGYSTKEERDNFLNKCLENDYKRSLQSVRNTLNFFTEKGILVKPKNSQRYISRDFSPEYNGEKIGITYKMTHK